MQFQQLPFLALLCAAFLISVLFFGIVKMRINTMKGVLSERMLRRFRYTLMTRVLRFPQSYFQRTSQGELVSMITSESEPMGGLMGDALSQPVLQAGQMLTILSFLFLQSFWFGLAAIALIPLQAWLIPKLQWQINLLNKKRIQQLRKLAAEIGESAAGASSLRTNGGWRYRSAVLTDRLGWLFDIRFQIYQKKFFMKFINNFITQLTPFFFFSIGGYLVIIGNISLGALVAALAAYKDLSSPWKELLQYYNAVADMSLRWDVITDRFFPKDMVKEELFDGEPENIPKLSGDIILKDVSVRDIDGNSVLEDISMSIAQGTTVAIASNSQEDRRAMAEVLTRELTPARGTVSIADHNLNELHQSVIAARIGHANSRPYVFDGTIGENLMMPLKTRPSHQADQPEDQSDYKRRLAEAVWAGNSEDSLHADWMTPQIAGLESEREVRDWWLTLVEGMGSGDVLFRRGLDQRFVESEHQELADKLLELRPVITRKIEEAGLQDLYYPIEWEKYNPALPIGGNLLYSTPRQMISQQALAQNKGFTLLLRELDLESGILQVSQEVITILSKTFGTDGTEHPLFRKLGIDPDVYLQSVEYVKKTREGGISALSEEELALLLTTPFRITAEQIGPAFSDDLKAKILALRHENRKLLQARLKSLFAPLDPEDFTPFFTVLENAIYGKISLAAGTKVDALRELVSEVLLEAGMKRHIAELVYDVPTGIAGANLSSMFAERLAMVRAAIKRPDILILDSALASWDVETRITAARKLRGVLPDATIIFLEQNFDHPENFATYIELENGRIKNGKQAAIHAEENLGDADMGKKIRLLEQTELFAGLSRKQLRLLAFGANWFTEKADKYIFRRGDDPSDGAYLVYKGEAGLYFPLEGQEDRLVTTVKDGRLIGDLALLQTEERKLHLKTHTDVKALRIGKEEFLAVVENDAATAFKMLQAVSGHLTNAAESIRELQEAQVTDKAPAK